MVTLNVPSHMLRVARTAPGPVLLEPGPWRHVAEQLQERLPSVASHVLADGEGLASGFVVVVNGRVETDVSAMRLADGDAMVLIPIISGG
jgi:molybdopterin converting factor small subunit